MDLNGDGVLDIVSGSYGGILTLYAGVEGGGLAAPQELMQYYNPSNKSNFDEVQFSSLTFGDYNGDGLLDGFVGGIRGIRVMLNVGTAAEPKFSKRELLYKVDGKPISVYYEHEEGCDAPDYKSYTYLIDWDRDGINDIITSCAYEFGGQHSIQFFKGVDVNGERLYEEGVPLFEQAAGEKALPGSYIMPNFCDYNKDGVMDMLVGVKLKHNAEEESFDTEGAYCFSAPMYSVLSYHLGVLAKDKYGDNPEALATEQQRIKELCAEMSKTEVFKSNPNPYAKGYKQKGYLMYFQGK